VSRRGQAILIAAALTVVIAAVFAFALVRASQNSSPLDPGLRKTAERMLLVLPQPQQQFSSTYGVHQALLSYERDALQDMETNASRVSRPGQFEQVQIYDPSSMPPQFLTVNLPGHPQVVLAGDAVSKTESSGQSRYVSVSQNGTDLRVYITRLRLPELFQSQGVVGVLEVFQPE
jgi:hypothetical protein